MNNDLPHPEDEGINPEDTIIQTVINVMLPLVNKTGEMEAIRSVRLVVEGRATETTARQDLKAVLHSLDYQAPEGKQGTLEDLSSEARLNLTVQTSTDLVRGYRQREGGTTEATLDEWPCMELRRKEEREVPRGTNEGYPDEYWQRKWKELGGTLYDGRMICRKDDPIALEISDFGLPYGPPGLNSGYNWEDITRDEAIELSVSNKDGQPFRQDTTVNVQHTHFEEHFKDRLEWALKQFIGLDPLGDNME